MHLNSQEIFEDYISLDIIYKIVYFNFNFRITLIVKLNQRSEQLFKYIIKNYLISAKVNAIIKIKILKSKK